MVWEGSTKVKKFWWRRDNGDIKDCCMWWRNSIFRKIERIDKWVLREKANSLWFCFLEGTKDLALEKVIYIESNLHKLIFHIFEGELVQYTMYETLNKISEMVSEDFLRIHQSYLVNLKFIRRLDGNQLLLSNGDTLLIARSKLKETRNRVAIYKGDL